MRRTLDLQEFLSAYLAEADEQLAVANKHVLEIETHLREGRSHPARRPRSLRALHTLKGLSAMVGVEPIVAVAHRMESSLRGADQAGGALTAASLDTLLKGTRAIELRLRALSENKECPRLLARCSTSSTRWSCPVGQQGRSPRGSSHSIRRSRRSWPRSSSMRSRPRTGTVAARSGWTSRRRQSGRRMASRSQRARAGGHHRGDREGAAAVRREDRGQPGGISFALLLLSAAPSASIADAMGVQPEAVLELTSSPLTAPAEPDDLLGGPGQLHDELAPAGERARASSAWTSSGWTTRWSSSPP